jgi:Bardet-Biedl syndrome 9 protein
MIGFSYPNKSEVTLIVSKNAGRYRIQSNHYECLLFITHQIISRLSECYQYEISFFIEDEINLLSFYNVVENHFRISSSKMMKHQELEKYTTLYAFVQKSLLNKYKVNYKSKSYKLGKKSAQFEQFRFPFKKYLQVDKFRC